MSVILPIVLNGVLNADGSLKLDHRPELPPGRVRVTLQLLPEALRLPDPPWNDESVPAPFDLPRFGTAERVLPRLAGERLPDPFESSRDDVR